MVDVAAHALAVVAADSLPDTVGVSAHASVVAAGSLPGTADVVAHASAAVVVPPSHDRRSRIRSASHTPHPRNVSYTGCADLIYNCTVKHRPFCYIRT